MLNTEEKLQNLLNSSLQSTKSEIAHTLSAYIRTLDEEYSDHCQKARVRAEHEVELESERLTREGNRSLAEEQLHLRRRIRREEEDLTARLFEEVEDRLEAYMATPAYKELLLSQIQSAAAFAGGRPVQIFLDPADEELLGELTEASGLPLLLADHSFHGGTRALIPERHILIDNSFESRLEEVRAGFSWERRARHDG